MSTTPTKKKKTKNLKFFSHICKYNILCRRISQMTSRGYFQFSIHYTGISLNNEYETVTFINYLRIFNIERIYLKYK